MGATATSPQTVIRSATWTCPTCGQPHPTWPELGRHFLSCRLPVVSASA